MDARRACDGINKAVNDGFRKAIPDPITLGQGSVHLSKLKSERTGNISYRIGFLVIYGHQRR